MAKKESLDVIINDMKRNPHHWRLDQFRVMHRNGMKIWIGNGFFGYHVEQPNYYEPTLREKWQLHKALRRLRAYIADYIACLLYTSPSPRDVEESRMPSSA